MGALHVHEFMSLDGVIDTPTWTFDFGFDPQMGETIGALTSRSGGILLGRTTYEMFEPAWSQRTAEDDPGAVWRKAISAFGWPPPSVRRRMAWTAPREPCVLLPSPRGSYTLAWLAFSATIDARPRVLRQEVLYDHDIDIKVNRAEMLRPR